MLFPTLEFALFFLIVFPASWALAGQTEWRKLLLLAASYFFYGWWDWRFMTLLAISSALNWGVGVMLHRTAIKGLGRQRKLYMLAGVAANLVILGFFKYFEFFLTGFSDILTVAGFERDIPLMEVILPIGISFFTFQGISYVVDVYRGQIEHVKSPVDLFLFISFFPQLVAGPIVRAKDFLPQLDRRPKLDDAAIAFGFTLILIGMFKKLVVAHYLSADIVDDVFASPGFYSGVDLLWACYAYAVQIYCDFSGYSDMAIGLAALLGYRFRTNFDRPLASLSLQKFWNRWHISLSSFLRDYLFRALRGANKQGKARTQVNVFLVMLLGGLWHGAAWTFVIWGALHGGALVIERLVKDGYAAIEPRVVQLRDRIAGALFINPAHIDAVPWGGILGWAVTFHVFALSAIFFRADDFATSLEYISRLWQWPAGPSQLTPFVVGLVVLSVAIQFAPKDMHKKFAKRIENMGAYGYGAYLGFGLVMVKLVAPSEVAPFIYFQF